MAAGLDSALAALLEAGGPAAVVVRALLAGMREALASGPFPGTGDAVDAIDRVLAGPGVSVFVPVAPDVRTRPSALDLSGLWEEAAGIAGERNPGTAPDDPGRQWEEIHLFGLRMGEGERADLAARAEESARTAGGVTGSAGRTILGPDRCELVPGLRVGEHVVHPGLATDPSGPPPAEFPGSADDFVRLAAPVLHLIGVDRYLAHCLQVLQFRGLATLDSPTEQKRLRDQIVTRTAALLDSPGELERLVRAHEAVVSVVHVPPAPDTSYWGGLRTRAHTLVRDAAVALGPGLVKLPPARFAAARALTSHDIPLQVPESSGMVLACVRVWSTIHGTENPGRVIYGS